MSEKSKIPGSGSMESSVEQVFHGPVYGVAGTVEGDQIISGKTKNNKLQSIETSKHKENDLEEKGVVTDIALDLSEYTPEELQAFIAMVLKKAESTSSGILKLTYYEEGQ